VANQISATGQISVKKVKILVSVSKNINYQSVSNKNSFYQLSVS